MDFLGLKQQSTHAQYFKTIAEALRNKSEENANLSDAEIHQSLMNLINETQMNSEANETNEAQFSKIEDIERRVEALEKRRSTSHTQGATALTGTKTKSEAVANLYRSQE